MDPTLKSRLIANLKQDVSALSPQLRVAAKYIIDHPSEFGLDPIRDTATKAKVSTYTLVNIAKHMGFPSYDDFRKPFRDALISHAVPGKDPARLADARASGELGRAYADAAENALSIVGRSVERQTLEQFNAIADTLFAADRVFVTAVRSSYAIAYYLHYVGRMALPALHLIPRHQNSAIDDLNDAGPGDVLIAISITPYSRETIEACNFARNRGVKLLTISDSEVIAADLRPEHSLVASVLSTHRFGCFSGMMAVIETLLAVLMHRGGAEAQQRIDSYEDLRRRNNAYWVAPTKKQ